MATIGKVAAIFSASTSGLKSGVADAVRSFKQMGGEAGKLSTAFKVLRDAGARGVGDVGPAAARATAKLATMESMAARLQAGLASGAISAADFARKMDMITAEAARMSASVSRGVAITMQFENAEEKNARTMAELSSLLKDGTISFETYYRAVAQAEKTLADETGVTAAAEQAARSLADAQKQAADAVTASRQKGQAITDSVMTAEERYNARVVELDTSLREGSISQETFARATQAAKQELNDATGVTAAQEQAFQNMVDVHQRGAAVFADVATAEERHANKLEDLRGLLAAGAINQQTFNRAVSKADDELRQANAGTDKFSGALGGAETALAKVNSKLNALIGIQAAQLFSSVASAVSNAARSLISYGADQAGVVDGTRNLAIRLGMTYGEFAGIAHAANLADVSMESVGSAAQKAEVNFAKAANGSHVAQAAFGALGLSVEELGAMSPAQRFQAIAAALKNVPDSAERARLAVALFGRSGGELLPMFEEGAAGIGDAAREAERFGLALTKGQSDSIDSMGDAFQKAQQAVAGVVQQVVAYLAPALENITTTFTDLVGGIGGANIGQFIGDAILNAAVYFAGIADYFIAGATSLWEYASTVGVQWNTVWEYANRAAAFFAGVGDAFKAGLAAAMLGIVTPFAMILTGIKEAAGMLGYESAALNSAVAGMDAFRGSLGTDMEAAAASAAKNFNYAFTGEGGPKAAGGEAKKGPLAMSLQESIDKAKADAAAKNAASPQTIAAKDQKPPGEVAAVGQSTEALKAVDSRSKEGIAEMFRLQRGASDDFQERIARAAERTADAVEQSEDPDLVEMAGA
jgi:hypothetical protein